VTDILLANPSHQHTLFNYRVPEHEKPFVADIRAGHQVVLMPRDMNDMQVKKVVEQMERYGFVPESDVRSILNPRSLVFSLRKPVSSDKIDEARERNETLRQEIADQEIENAGVSTVPPGLPRDLQDAVRHGQQTSTLEVRQIENLESERGVKNGVDTTITVSKKAGAKTRNRG
jgi:hypothetical protein